MRKIFWLIFSLCIVVADQVTKYYAVKHLILFQPHAVFPGLNFTLVYNYGAAFSFLNMPSVWVSWFFTVLSIVISIAIVIWLFRLSPCQIFTSMALACILGGAIGNVLNRIALGYVIDFIDVYYKTWHWPAFNIADSAICVGAVLLCVVYVRAKH